MSSLPISTLASELSQLKIFEVVELVSVLEEAWGVSATPVIAEPNSGHVIDEPPEDRLFALEVRGFGGKKIAVIKEIRAVIGLGLQEAVQFINALPQCLPNTELALADAEALRDKLIAVGADVVLK